MAVAIDGGEVVGFASGVHYVHPDKPSEMWINEVGVAPSHQGHGLGKAVVGALVQHAGKLGCREAWVLTERTNRLPNKLAASGVPGRQESLVQVCLDRALENVGVIEVLDLHVVLGGAD